MNMLTIDDIHQLIAQGKTVTLELKKTTGELKDAMHSACALLNSQGGWLMFGITPQSLRIMGENVSDDTRLEIANALRGLEPRIDVSVQYIDVPDRPNNQVVAIHFNAWQRGMAPFTYCGCPYWRVESATERMPREVYDERLRSSQSPIFSWERLPAYGLTIDHLDDNRIRQVVRIGVDNGRMPATAMADSKEEVLRKLGLLVNGQVTNAAAALFVREEYAYPQFLLRMAHFRGTDKSAFRDNKRKKGNLFDLLDAGIEFLCDKLAVSGEIVGLLRTEQYEVPLKALREALINALCHRDYAYASDSVSVAVYADRVEIGNPGKLPIGLTPQNIKTSHASRPYNPIIAEVLYKSTFLENWGSGVQRMIDECKAVGVPELVYHTTNHEVIISFPRLSFQVVKIREIIVSH